MTMWYSCKQCDVSEILLEIHIKHTFLHYSLLPSSKHFFFFAVKVRGLKSPFHGKEPSPDMYQYRTSSSWWFFSSYWQGKRPVQCWSHWYMSLLEPEMVLWPSLARLVHCILPLTWPGHPGSLGNRRRSNSLSTASPTTSNTRKGIWGVHTPSSLTYGLVTSTIERREGTQMIFKSLCGYGNGCDECYGEK